MTTRELFAPEIPSTPDSSRVAPDSGLPKPGQHAPEFAAVIERELRPQPKRVRTELTPRPTPTERAPNPSRSPRDRSFAPRAQPPAPTQLPSAVPPTNECAAPALPAVQASTSTALDSETPTELDLETPQAPNATEPDDSTQAAVSAGLIVFTVQPPAVILPFPQTPAFGGSNSVEPRAILPEVPEPPAAWSPQSGSSLIRLPAAEGTSPILLTAPEADSSETSLADVEIDVAWPLRQSATKPGEPIEFQTPADRPSAGAASDRIVAVDFRPAQTQSTVETTVVRLPSALAPLASGAATLPLLTVLPAPSHLPGLEAERENSAPLPWVGAALPVETVVSQPRSTALFAGDPALPEGVTGAWVGADGIAAALKVPDMDSLLDANQATGAASAPTLIEDHQKALEELDGISVKVSEPESGSPDISARSLGAMEWQTGRPVGLTDRPAPSPGVPATPAGGVDRSEAVERLSQLVLRETALARQHGADSMSVVLRPDADTELFVHFTQKNGQLQAAVRCERGDFQHLNTLWTQLQESLAQQRVSLAPLEESSTPGDFRHAHGSNSGGAGPGNDPSRQHGAHRNEVDADETDVPRRAMVPESGSGWGQGGRKTGATPVPSRPGWETWA